MIWPPENADQMQEELKQQPSMIERLYGKCVCAMIERLYGKCVCAMIERLYGKCVCAMIERLYGKCVCAMIERLYGKCVCHEGVFLRALKMSGGKGVFNDVSWLENMSCIVTKNYYVLCSVVWCACVMYGVCSVCESHGIFPCHTALITDLYMDRATFKVCVCVRERERERVLGKKC